MSVSAQSARQAIEMQWGLRIPMRDGVHLSGTLYLPRDYAAPHPVIFSLTPYVGQFLHEYAVYFASNGYPFVAVDVRGRGNSEGEAFKPFVHDGEDGFDVVEWLAGQPYCNGQVAMWGGSYTGFTQWAVAKEFPPHLETIVPVASVHPGVDFPIRNNIARPYSMQWLAYVSGRALQDKIFADACFWRRQFKSWFESGASYRELDQFLGIPSAAFQEWVDHPEQGRYWDRLNPTPEQYARLNFPILTITGQYDGDQPGALAHYWNLIKQGSCAAHRHCLVIGPWDHAGTRDPKLGFSGLKAGPESLVDLGKLHLEWYAWTMQAGPRPQFLKKNVAYYVMAADRWRYADTLEAITARSQPLYLQSNGNPGDVFRSGVLGRKPAARSDPDHYIHDPRDVSLAELESSVDLADTRDSRMIHARAGRHLIYHSAPFEQDTEVSGFFKLVAWLAIDRPDTDFRASVYEIGLDGASTLLTVDSIRARYRDSLREAKLIDSHEPLRYDFDRFMFISRLIERGHRLRLVIGPIHSIYSEKNHNSGGIVADESLADARPVTVSLFHDEQRPSALYVPYGQHAL